MREVKFRGKRIDNGEWVEGYLYISNISGCYILRCESFAKRTKGGLNMGDKVVSFVVDPDTLGQFTGLRDKNGKEIYEGDILLWGDSAGVVVWNDNGYCMKDNAEHMDCTFINPYSYKYYEVIGNIHDNPELLKGKTQ